jgi:hypothetical protein
VLHVKTRGPAEHLHFEPVEASRAGRGEIDLAWMSPHVGYELLDGARREVGIGNQDVRRLRHQRNSYKILLRFEMQPRKQRRIDGERANIAEKDGVAVGRSACGLRHADIAGRARPVVDDNGLSEKLRHAVLHNARDKVGGAGGRERHDHPDRLAGVVSGISREACGRRKRQHDDYSSDQFTHANLRRPRVFVG